MKNTLTFFALFFVTSMLFAQTDGISYQAVIIGPDKQELPGVDAEGNIFPDAAIAIRFTILDETNSVEYQEVQTTNTDAFGRINLLIGSMNPNEFTKISWDGTNKDLKVEIDFSGAGSNFLDMSREQLTFVPYAYHRNITAAGTLKVDDATELNSELLVKGPTQLESVLAVGGNTDLNSDLLVLGATHLNDSLNLNKGKAANLSGNLTVLGTADLKGDTKLERIDVAGTSMLNGQVTIDVNMDNENTGEEYRNYPLLIEGSEQGIAIKVNGNRSTSNNYITFWDQTGTDIERGSMWGRIEGITLTELENDAGYKRGLRLNNFNIAAETINSALAIVEIYSAATNSSATLVDIRPCAGVGACVVGPGVVIIAWSLQDLIIKIANAVETGIKLVIAVQDRKIYLNTAKNNIGVSYQSGARDYAEWLLKENTSDVFEAGDLVGIRNGRVTKNTWGVEKIMIVSTRPIVLGNMPQPGHEKNSVKIAFMGQVPTKVLGKVAPGDYILPNELGIGFARAVHPENMKTRDYKKIAGVAWNVIEEISPGLSTVNVAVGINTNDLSEVVVLQEEKLKVLKDALNQLQAQMTESNTVLASLVPGYAEALSTTINTTRLPVEVMSEDQSENSKDQNFIHTSEDDLIYFEISKEQIEAAFIIAREQYQEILIDQNQASKLLTNKNSTSALYTKTENGSSDNLQNKLAIIAIEDHPFWQRIDSDPNYKEEIIQYIQYSMEKSFHMHKKHAHNFTDLKVRE